MGRSSGAQPPTAVAPVLGLLRFITCGSVDDGKSTLIGRLLLDADGVFADQLAEARRATAALGQEGVDLAMLTDGLRAEREQGITIDVAYRYFSSSRRRFILADTPGHAQYTRNMATAASTADVAVILIDARKGVLEQTRRHASLAVLLGVRRLIVCVNKMDLVGYDRARFTQIVGEFGAFLDRVAVDEHSIPTHKVAVTYVPMCALTGENVVRLSDHTPWFDEPPLMEQLELVELSREGEAGANEPARLPIQLVLRPRAGDDLDYRGYAGKLVRGSLRVGDEVVALPGGQRTRITRIHVGTQDLEQCDSPRSIAVTLKDELDLVRGEMLVSSPPSASDDLPRVLREIEATLVAMARTPIAPGARILLKHTSRTVPGVVSALAGRFDLTTLTTDSGATELQMNEIGRASLRLGEPIFVDAYDRCRATGSFILIDPQTNATIGAGIIR